MGLQAVPPRERWCWGVIAPSQPNAFCELRERQRNFRGQQHSLRLICLLPRYCLFCVLLPCFCERGFFLCFFFCVILSFFVRASSLAHVLVRGVRQSRGRAGPRRVGIFSRGARRVDGAHDTLDTHGPNPTLVVPEHKSTKGWVPLPPVRGGG